MKRKILILILLLTRTLMFSQSLLSFIDVEFGIEGTLMGSKLHRMGCEWMGGSEFSQRYQCLYPILFSNLQINGNIYYYTTLNDTLYGIQYSLYSNNQEISSIESFISEYVTENELIFFTNIDELQFYISKESYIYEFKIYNNDNPYLEVKIIDPLYYSPAEYFNRYEDIKMETLDPFLESIDEQYIIKKGKGNNFYYYVVRYPSDNIDALYLCNSQNFDSKVYLFINYYPYSLGKSFLIDENTTLLKFSTGSRPTFYYPDWCNEIVYCEVFSKGDGDRFERMR